MTKFCKNCKYLSYYWGASYNCNCPAVMHVDLVDGPKPIPARDARATTCGVDAKFFEQRPLPPLPPEPLPPEPAPKPKTLWAKFVEWVG